MVAILPFAGTAASRSLKAAKQTAKELAERTGREAAQIGVRKISEAIKILNDAPNRLLTNAEREMIASVIENPKLKNTFNALFQTSDEFPGGTAGAVKHYAKTGNLIKGSTHITKARERIRNLEKILERGDLSAADVEIVNILLKQLKEALSLVK